MLRLFWGILFFMIIAFSIQAQPAKWQKNIGLQLLAAEQYAKAITTLKSYHQNDVNDEETLMAIAICSYHLNDIAAAERYLNLIQQRGRIQDNRLILYKARLNYVQGNYEKAVIDYKLYFKKEKNAAESIKQELLQCANGLKISPVYTNTSSLEVLTSMNSSSDDEGLLASPTQNNCYYFSSNRNGNYDLFFIDSNYIVLSLETPINSAKDELLGGFSSDGSNIYFFRKDSLCTFTFLENKKNKTLPPYVINTPFWYNDSIVLFSSNQLGGYGGYDLFFTVFKNKTWTPPSNLGNIINSPFDEQYPFLANDGQTLFFSTNQTSISIGGFDIVMSQFDTTIKAWQQPQALKSLNTYADETHFFLNEEKNIIFFTSNHWSSQGGKDIFKMELNDNLKFLPNDSFFDDSEQGISQFKISSLAVTYRIFIAKTDVTETPDIEGVLTIPPHKDSTTQSHYVGNYQSFFSAQELLEELKKTGWENAEIVVFQEDKLIKEEDIERLITIYPDLNEYVNYKKQLKKE